MKRNSQPLFQDVHPVLMLARNALELTKRAVESVLAQDIPTILYAVNNHSTDGTEEYLDGLAPRVVIQTFKPAQGVSASWNWGLTEIFRTWDHCLVLNNDLILRSDTYSALLADGGQFVTAVSVDDPARIEGEWRKAPRPHPDFSAYLIRREAWQRVGAFDESMVLYASDADMHIRLHQAGIEAYTIGIPFYHVASGTLKSAGPFEKARIQAQADKDRETFANKWGVAVGSAEYYRLFGHGAPDESA